MKSLLIVFGMCALFLALSAKLPETDRLAYTASGLDKRCSVTENNNGAAMPALKRAKTGRLPRWHRLIPGMFR